MGNFLQLVMHHNSRVLLVLVFIMQLLLKILSTMANSVDPDQTAPSGAV